MKYGVLILTQKLSVRSVCESLRRKENSQSIIDDQRVLSLGADGQSASLQEDPAVYVFLTASEETRKR